MKFARHVFTGPILFSWILFFSACGASVRYPGPESEYVLGTICTVNLYDQGNAALYSRIFARLGELEDIFSANREDTDLGRINQNAGLEPVKVRPELIEVLSIALEYAQESNGYFDPTVGPLVKLWGIGTENARVPAEAEIRDILELIDYREVEINREAGTVFLGKPGMALDLGGIAKGYAADEIKRSLEREGVERAIIDLGGNIFAMGEKKAGRNLFSAIKETIAGSRSKTDEEDTFWRIGIQDPREGRGNYIGIVKVKNKTVVTSGIYERYFEEGEKHYHHIFSTMDGFPVDNGIVSVTIVSESSIDADALSTAVFTLGRERGCDFINSVHGAGGIFVFDDMTVRLTEGLEKDFTLTAMEYRLDKQ